MEGGECGFWFLTEYPCRTYTALSLCSLKRNAPIGRKGDRTSLPHDHTSAMYSPRSLSVTLRYKPANVANNKKNVSVLALHFLDAQFKSLPATCKLTGATSLTRTSSDRDQSNVFMPSSASAFCLFSARRVQCVYGGCTSGSSSILASCLRWFGRSRCAMSTIAVEHSNLSASGST